MQTTPPFTSDDGHDTKCQRERAARMGAIEVKKKRQSRLGGLPPETSGRSKKDGKEKRNGRANGRSCVCAVRGHDERPTSKPARSTRSVRPKRRRGASMTARSRHHHSSPYLSLSLQMKQHKEKKGAAPGRRKTSTERPARVGSALRGRGRTKKASFSLGRARTTGEERFSQSMLGWRASSARPRRR